MSITHDTKVHLGAYVPRELYDQIATLARKNDRAISAELRVAAQRHLDATAKGGRHAS